MLRSFCDSTIFGESFGEGPVRVVWLHGWARRAQDFTAAGADLARRGVASIALDLPGFGASPLPLVPGGARHYAELVVPALREISDEPVVLVGHSFGGRIATVIASRHPEVVSSLILTGVPLVRLASTKRPPVAYRLLRWLHFRGFVSDTRIERARQKYGSDDYRRSSGLLRQVLVANVNESYEAELAVITRPVVLLWGDGDSEVPVEVSRRASSILTSGHDLRVLPGIGHLVPLEAPTALVDVVVEMLRP